MHLFTIITTAVIYCGPTGLSWSNQTMMNLGLITGIKVQLLGLWRFRARRMSWDDIESENSLITLASTSPNSAPPRTELVKICAKANKGEV